MNAYRRRCVPGHLPSRLLLSCLLLLGIGPTCHASPQAAPLAGQGATSPRSLMHPDSSQVIIPMQAPAGMQAPARTAPTSPPLRVGGEAKALKDPLAGPVVVRGDAAKTHREMIEKGQRHLKAGNTSAAQSLFELVASRHGDSVEAHIGMAAAALLENRLGDADAHFRNALALAPEHAVAKPMSLALRAAQTGEAGEAIHLLHDLIQSDPGNGLLHFVLGNLHARRGQWDEAAAAYRGALASMPDCRACIHNLAVAEDRRGRIDAAVTYYRQALRDMPGQHPLFDVERARHRLDTLAARLAPPARAATR